jgi:dTDP-4-amino-4,6-dideoxygalactose transaminase
VGREQLKRLPELVLARRKGAEFYRGVLGDIKGLGLPSEPTWARSNWQSYCVRLPAHVDQRRAMQSLLDLGISTRRGVMCSHREPAYVDFAHRPLPRSEEAQDRCVLLPLFASITTDQLFEAAQALQEVCSS